MTRVDGTVVDALLLDGGGVLHHLRRGPTGGAEVLVVPGLLDGLAPIWTDIGLAVARAAAPDRLGHLRGTMVSHAHPLDRDGSIADLADDLEVLVEQLDLGPVVVSGHSLGGIVALRLAARAPALVRAVIATGCGLGTSDAMRRHLTAPAAPREAPVPDELRQRHRRLAAALLDHDAGPDARDVRAPVLLIGGREDELVPAVHAEALAARLQDVRLHLLDGLGHDFPERMPDRLAALVADFLDDLGIA